MAYSRRKFLQGTVGMALGGVASPWVKAQPPTLSISVNDRSPLYAVKSLAERDLGITLDLQSGMYSNRLQDAVLDAHKCHLAEFRSNNARGLWNSRAVQPIDLSRLQNWQEVSSTLDQIKRLSSSNTSVPEFGDLPCASLYIQSNGVPTAEESAIATHVPFCLSTDSLTYNSDLLPEDLVQNPSWGWLLDDRLHGRVALSNSPAIGYYELAMAMKSISPDLIANPCSPTSAELKRFYQNLLDQGAEGQFSAFWNHPEDIVESLKRGETLVTNLSSRDIPLIQSKGVRLRQADLKEGFRGWAYGLYLTISASNQDQEIAYEFLNWLLSGSPGSEISRMGYTSTTPELSRQHMSANDWGYWYHGEASTTAIYDPAGYPVAEVGESRSGGSFAERFSRIAIWTNGPTPHMDTILENWGRLITLG